MMSLAVAIGLTGHIMCRIGPCILEWVDVGTSTKVRWRFVGFHEKVRKIAIKIFRPLTSKGT
jgi:hypothetical protein